MRWEDGVDQDIENIRGYELEEDRDKWSKLLKKARHQGMSSQ